MITLQHSLVTLLGINEKEKNREDIEEEFRKIIPYALLPDGIRRITGPRAYSHFEESSDGSDVAYMKFPQDLKSFSKEKFETDTSKHIVSQQPAALGEKTHIEKFVEENSDLPRDYFAGVKKHLTQDIIFDEFIRKIIDCSNKYEDVYTFDGKKYNGNEIRKLIADIETEGFEIISYMAYKKLGITTNQEWFDKNVKKVLDESYPQGLADSTYTYMKIPPKINENITNHDFSDLEEKIKSNSTIIPYEQYEKMYELAIDGTKQVDDDMLKSIDTRNIDQLKIYLKSIGLDESLAESPYFLKRFKIEQDDGTRFFLHTEDNGSKLTGRDRDQIGFHSVHSDFRIRKEGKAIVIEELRRSLTEGSDESKTLKTTTYIDENGEDELIRRSQYTDVYGHHIDEYVTNKSAIDKVLREDAKSDMPGEYQSVENIEKLVELQKENKSLKKSNRDNIKRLNRAIEFAEKVKSSRIGKLFFGKSIKKLESANEDQEQEL